jgi:hypothetical protein
MKTGTFKDCGAEHAAVPETVVRTDTSRLCDAVLRLDARSDSANFPFGLLFVT